MLAVQCLPVPWMWPLSPVLSGVRVRAGAAPMNKVERQARDLTAPVVGAVVA